MLLYAYLEDALFCLSPNLVDRIKSGTMCYVLRGVNINVSFSEINNVKM